MSGLLNWIGQNLEVLFTSMVAICLICYVIDGFTYKRERKRLYHQFKQQQATEQDKLAFLHRLETLRPKLKRSQQMAFHDTEAAVKSGELLSKHHLNWLRVPVYPAEKFIEFFSSVFWLIFIIWFFRFFIAEYFRIPSSSMEPTLQNGDFILTQRFSYAVRLPVVHTKLWDTGKVARGDVVVFRFPQNPKLQYIKRVVAIPGDKVKIEQGRVWINGVEQTLTQSSGANPEFVYYQEHLGDITHAVQFTKNPTLRVKISGEVVVPEGKYFVMGDNRDNSADSRFWGFVSDDELIGKALFIILNKDCLLGRGYCVRIGQRIE